MNDSPRPPYFRGPAPRHPSAQHALVLGLVGLAGAPVCMGVTLLLSPFAWGVGRQALREIDEGQGAWRGRDEARIGYLTGIVGTALLALGLVAVVVVVLVLVAADA